MSAEDRVSGPPEPPPAANPVEPDRGVVAALAEFRSVRHGSVGAGWEHRVTVLAWNLAVALDDAGELPDVMRSRPEGVDVEAGPISTAVTASLRNWALMYPIPAWSLAQGDLAERLADNWARVASGMVMEAIAGEFQWGVRTTYADGSQGIDWVNEDEARDFLALSAEYDAEPHMQHLRTRELVRRPIVAGEIDVAESDYDTRRQAADERVMNRRPKQS